MRPLATLSVLTLVACATSPAPAPPPTEQKPVGARWVARPVEGLGLFKDERDESARVLMILL